MTPESHTDPVNDFLREKEASQSARPAMDISADSLKRLKTILALLGDPQDALGPVVHLAGTNGKGSTLATLKAMAEADGRKVNCLTSPYLVNAHEQIRLNGHFISDSDFIDHLRTLFETAEREGLTLTRFEATTLAAFLAFRETAADLTLLETGLGGRLDATNVVLKPALQVITSVSFDHQEILGHSLAQITREKAGIMRQGGLAIVAPQNDVAAKELVTSASKLGSRVSMAGRDWRFRLQDGQLMVLDQLGGFTGPAPLLRGDHQLENAATALVAARSLGPHRISDAALRAGLGWVRWPARLQDLSETDLKTHVPTGTEIHVDGGHNPAAGDMLGQFLRQEEWESSEITVIASMKKNKDPVAFFKPFVGRVGKVITVPLWQDDTGFEPADLSGVISQLGIASVPARNLIGALDRVKKTARPGKKALVLMAGSFRLAGEALLLAGQPPR